MRNRTIVSFGIVLLITLTLAVFAQEPARGGGGGQGRGAGAGGGGGRGGAPPTNLQVLPKDWTRQQVVQVMQQFTMGLGVQCNYCHAEMAGAQPGANGQVPLDAASDEKQQKKTARVMMKMVNDVNNTLGSQIGKPAADVVKVQCITCHRGSAIPKTQCAVRLTDKQLGSCCPNAEVRNFPLLSEEGWPRHQLNIAKPLLWSGRGSDQIPTDLVGGSSPARLRG